MSELLELPPKDRAYQQILDTFSHHVPVFKAKYEAVYAEVLEYPIEDFSLLEYGPGGIDPGNAQPCSLIGANSIDLTTVQFVKGEEGSYDSNLNNHNFIKIYAFLYDAYGEPFVADGDNTEETINGCDNNDYTLAFGRECYPIAIQSGQLNQNGWFTPEEVSKARKHQLSDLDCVNLLALYVQQAKRIRTDLDVSLNLSYYP